MSEKIELEIKTAKDREEVGRILLANQYRVWMETRKGNGSARATVLCADKPEKGGNNA